MRRKSYTVEVIQVILAVAVIIMTVILFIDSTKYAVLYPAVFGSSALLSCIHAFAGIADSENRAVRRRHEVFFGIAALFLAVIAFVSLKAVI